MDRLPPSLHACRKLQPDSLAGIDHLDIVLAIDTSASTHDATGLDIDGDGSIGRRSRVRHGLLSAQGSTDRGDSYLGAQILAGRALVHGLRSRGNRFAIVAWAGELSSSPTVRSPDIRSTYDFAQDPRVVDASLREVFRAGSLGNSNLAPPITHGVGLLASSPPSRSKSVILLIADSAESYPRDNFEDWSIAVERASANSIVINTFAMGKEAIASPENLQAISEATGGALFLVENPSELHCELASSLLSP